MNTKRILFVLGFLLFLCSDLLLAQELTVSSFEYLQKDTYATINKRFDLNDNPCAVVRVSIANAKKYTFEGNIIGDVIYRPGEAIVYMTEGSRRLTIKSDEFGSLQHDWGSKLDRLCTYRLVARLETPEHKKTRTMVMPVVGVSGSISYGLMVGVVKKWGWYLKAKYDFKSQETQLECDATGMMSNGNMLWMSGESASTRLAVTTGAMYRLAKPLYMYMGAGYGYHKIAWETIEGEWAENTTDSSSGVEADLGLVLRAGNVAFSAGVQSNSFKYFEATVGVGIMF